MLLLIIGSCFSFCFSASIQKLSSADASICVYRWESLGTMAVVMMTEMKYDLYTWLLTGSKIFIIYHMTDRCWVFNYLQVFVESLQLSTTRTLFMSSFNTFPHVTYFSFTSSTLKVSKENYISGNNDLYFLIIVQLECVKGKVV